MKKIRICNKMGEVGKTTISLYLAGALAEKGKKGAACRYGQQGSLSSSFPPDIHCLSLVITDVIRDDRLPIEWVHIEALSRLINLAPTACAGLQRGVPHGGRRGSDQEFNGLLKQVRT